MSLLKVNFKTSRHGIDILLIDVLAFYSPSYVCEFYPSFLEISSVNFNDLGVFALLPGCCNSGNQDDLSYIFLLGGGFQI